MAKDLTDMVPFLAVSDIQRSVAHYVDGLGFTLKNRWDPDGKLRWCWLSRGAVSIMLQETAKPVVVGGINLCVMCEDAVALFRDLRKRVSATEPEVGNGAWVTRVDDPDGYQMYFESPTDVPEDTKLSELPAFANRDEW